MLFNTTASARRGIIISIFLIIILTILEFPAPIGFEVRPQNNVSLWWLILFLAIIISELFAFFSVFKKPHWGARAGVLAGTLNVLQVIADQMHLMQPELAPYYYLLLEDVVFLASCVLIFASYKILTTKD